MITYAIIATVLYLVELAIIIYIMKKPDVVDVKKNMEVAKKAAKKAEKATKKRKDIQKHVEKNYDNNDDPVDMLDSILSPTGDNHSKEKSPNRNKRQSKSKKRTD